MTINSLVKVEYDNWICNELEKAIIRRNCRSVHSYIPIANEIDVSPLLTKLLHLNITVVCPKTLPKRQLENRVLHSLDDQEVGIMGTKHPAKPDIYEGKIDLVIVPGLAFDAGKFRLGYGGAYYDTFLANHPATYKLGIFYPFQQVDVVPVESHDVQLDEILFKEFHQPIVGSA
jgi:5-formyltetrahydrofolate cyclo-ligase